jgi:hypothetical protein
MLSDNIKQLAMPNKNELLMKLLSGRIERNNRDKERNENELESNT